MSMVHTRNDPMELLEWLVPPRNPARRKRLEEAFVRRDPPVVVQFQDKPEPVIEPVKPRQRVRGIFVEPEHTSPSISYPQSGVGPVHLIRGKSERDLAWARRWIAFKHGLTIKEIEGQARWAKFVAARQEYFYYARMVLGKSYPEMARRLGGRDHTTALHGARKHADKHGLELV